MKEMISKIALLATMMLSTAVFASPDVFFTDSEDLYLCTDLVGDNHIKFVLMGGQKDGIKMPNEIFNEDRLKHYINNTHHFTTPALAKEFKKMMVGSMAEPRFDSDTFLEELLRVIAGFKSFEEIV